MIKACVFSDSHGTSKNMISAVELDHPDLVFFLGDGERDFRDLQERFPTLSYFAVCGNCDLGSGLGDLLVCTVGGVRILAVHGHRHRVKYEPGLETLAAAAKEAGASLALFGHTHCQALECRDGVTLLNPGSAGWGTYPAYAVLFLENSCFRAELKAL